MNVSASDPDRSLVGHWRGKAPLWSAYWIVGALGAVGAYCMGVSALLLSFLFFSQAYELVILLVVVGLLAYATFASIAIWRCWRNSSWIGWGVLARAQVILFASIAFLGFVAALTDDLPVA